MSTEPEDFPLAMVEADALRNGYCIALKGSKVVYSGEIADLLDHFGGKEATLNCTYETSPFDQIVMSPYDCARFQSFCEEEGSPLEDMEFKYHA